MRSPTAEAPSTVTWTVEQGHLFVMGDNRPISNDSRSALGQVPLARLEGAVLTGEEPTGCLSAPPAPTVEG